MALSFILSWYPTVDLSQLATRRSQADLVPHKDAIVTHAAALASYTDPDEFVRDRADDGTEVSEDIFGLDLDGDEEQGEEVDSSS